MTTKQQPIATRIRAAMKGRTVAPYYDVMEAVFPSSDYPRAWRYAAGGGPPGCAMAFGAAVARMGGSTAETCRGARAVWIPTEGRA